MPEIQDINEFKNDLIRLGNEPEIREQRGESLPNITVPETQSVDDLSALFDDVADDLDTLDEEGLFGEDEPDIDEVSSEDAGEGDADDLFSDAEMAADDFNLSEDSDDLGDDDFNLPEGLTEGLGEELGEAVGDDLGDVDFNLPEGLTEGLGEELGETDGDELVDDDFNLPEGLTDALGEELGETDGDELVDDEFNLPEGLTDALGEELGETDGDDLVDDEFNLPEGLTEGLGEELGEVADDEFAEADFAQPDGGPEVEPDELPDGLEVQELDDFDNVLPDVDEPEDESGAGDDFDLDGFDMEELGEELGEEPADADIDMNADADSIDDFDIDGFDMGELDTDDSGDTEVPGVEDFDSDEADTDDLEASDSDTDMFDTSELDGTDGETDSFSMDDEDGDDDFSLEDFSLEEIDGDDIDASEFSLGDLGEEFGVDDEEDSDTAQLEDLGDVPAELSEDFSDVYADDSYAIPDDDYIELKRTLGQMPRNLKLLIEELIGEKNLTGENLEKLIQALIRGAGAKELGSLVSKITGKKVRIPTQYERRTAEEFEKEKGTFAYVFKKNFIPMFRTAAIAAVVLGLVMFLGYRFVYTPLHAQSLYQKGYEEIPLGNNQQANAYFDQAFGEWQKKAWFYRYAESFIEQKQYILAEEKYEQLLGWYPDEREAVLDYAELEFKTLGKYPEAEKLLTDLLFDQLRDYEARLLLADTYMEWAREIDASKYEEARFNYAKLLEQYGSRDQLLFRMLRYFIRTDNHSEAMILYEAFRQNAKLDIEPDIYAELAGYLIDNEQLGDVREILMKAKSVDESIPEIHYELARYFDIIDIPFEEEKALNAAIYLYENTSPLTRTRNGMLIDSYNRFGIVLYENERYLDAEDYFQKAASNYDEAKAAGQIQAELKYGNIFSNLGDLAYYISGDYDQALKYFDKAELNMFSPPILKYKRGYIHYSNEDFRDALVEFYDTAGGFSVDRGLMYSTANALFNRNDYYLAEGYYSHLLDILNKDYASINYLLIDEIPEHRALLENIMKVSNNLGVTKYRLYERSRDPEKNAEAMVLLTDSVEYYDKLSRDPNSLIEPDTVNLSYLNSKAVFYPVNDYRLQIYQSIPKDLDKMNF